MRKPLPGLPLGFCNLAGAHFFRNLRPPDLGLADAVHGGEIEPFVGRDVVNANHSASGVGQPKVEEGMDAALARICLKLGQRITIKMCHVLTCPCI